MKAAAPARRSSSNDGHRSSVMQVLPIRPTLLAKLLAEFYEGRPEHAHKLYHGPRPATNSKASRFSDEQVLILRRMRHWHGMSISQIAKTTGLPELSIRGLCDYRNRVHLDPGPRPVPIEAEH